MFCAFQIPYKYQNPYIFYLFFYNLAILEQDWRFHLIGDLVAELGMQKVGSLCHSRVLE